LTGSLLEGLSVTVAGRARPLRVAARYLQDLGARVAATGTTRAGEADELWLGTFDPQEDGASRVDLVLVEHATPPPPGRTVVTYAGTGSRAERRLESLDERSLAAVGGLAVAIGEPDRPPLPLPDGCLDAMIGAHVAAAGLAGLLTAATEVEVAGADVAAWAEATNVHLYLPYALPWFRAGRRASGSGGCYPYALFDAADGLYCLIGRTDRDWRSLLAAMGHPGWANDPRFVDPRALGRRYPEEADAHVGAWTARHTREQLTEVMARHAFPGGPVLRPQEVLAAPSLAGRWRTATSGDATVNVPGSPFDVMTWPDPRPAPAFDHLFVLDLSWVWSGPAVGLGLADLGATVVKVESATRPDNTRLRGRPEAWATAPEAPSLELTPYFHALNRGKHSLSLDLTTEGGRGVLWDLAAKADVIVENLSPGVMERLGIPSDRVQEANPGCVFLSMPGYRDHPSTKGLRAYAPVLSAGAGIESLIAYPNEPPVGAMTFGFSDANAAGQGLLLVLAGLLARRRGLGSAITLSQLDAAVLANGHNLVAAQLGTALEGLEPVEEEGGVVVGANDLPTSPWVSRDLFGTVAAPWLGPLTVARLPWRRDGQLPALGRAGPLLGADTDRVLRSRLGVRAGRISELREVGALT
jgi:crotonobetainyl-CoA:carnitine CoA-transferase CaiB-like acyl-CoA transferase